MSKLERQTKAQLIDMVNRLSAEVAELRAQNSALRVQTEAQRTEKPTDVRYPFTDARGRHYRIETTRGVAVRCYPPSL